MSGGQQQRIAIARAAAANPDWLLLDELTFALDPEYTAEVLSMLRDGLRIILVTHHMGFARHACEQVAFLADGIVHESGPSDEAFGRPGDQKARLSCQALGARGLNAALLRAGGQDSLRNCPMAPARRARLVIC